MKNFVALAAFAASANAVALVGRGNCCFHLTASGGASGSVGQLSDGQNRIGDHKLPPAQYCISNGGITDEKGRGCILTPPTSQFQCDTGATPTTGFSINSQGELEYNGSPNFFACKTGDHGGMNIYTTTSSSESGCTSIMLNADSCSAPSSSSVAPVSSSVAPVSSSVAPVCSTIAPTSSSVAPAPVSSSVVPVSSSVAPVSSSMTPVPSTSTALPGPPCTTTTTVTVECGCSTTATPSPVPSSVSTPPAPPSSSAPAPVSSSVPPPPPSSSAPAPVSSSVPPPPPSTPTPTPTETPTPTPTPTETPTPVSTPPPSTSCATLTSGSFEFPHLIIPIDSSSPSTAEGTSFNGQVTSTTSSLFNFDIPESDSGKTCKLVFLFPQKQDLQTSSFTFSGDGKIDFAQLSSPATSQTSFSNAPGVAQDLGTFTVSPGNSYTVSTFSCPAGQTVAYEMKNAGTTNLNFFQDYNPCPLGLFITVQ